MFSPLSREKYRKGISFPYFCERIVYAINKGGTARPSSFCDEGFLYFLRRWWPWKKAGRCGHMVQIGKEVDELVITTDDLETTCPNCKGSGKEDRLPCPKCSGKGVILTGQGNTLLHFIKKHLHE